MPHAEDDWKREAEEDDNLIAKLLDANGSGRAENDELNKLDAEFQNGATGEKADDALDYGDISDDDLPDEEEDATSAVPLPTNGFGGHVETQLDDDDPFGDLFGDGDAGGGEGGVGGVQEGAGAGDGDFDDLFGGGDDDFAMPDAGDAGEAAVVKEEA